jgi:integral membrane sensor domain MASE1
VILAGAVSTAVSATIGVTSLVVTGELAGESFASLRMWWLGDMGGTC